MGEPSGGSVISPTVVGFRVERMVFSLRQISPLQERML
jgi:hypothetical protein